MFQFIKRIYNLGNTREPYVFIFRALLPNLFKAQLLAKIYVLFLTTGKSLKKPTRGDKQLNSRNSDLWPDIHYTFMLQLGGVTALQNLIIKYYIYALVKQHKSKHFIYYHQKYDICDEKSIYGRFIFRKDKLFMQVAVLPKRKSGLFRKNKKEA